MHELITNQLLEAVFTVVGLLIAAAVSYFAPKLKRQLAIWADKDNLGILESIAEKAVELVEEEFQGEEGSKKFNEAATFVSMMMNRYGIEASHELIKSSVQSGWRKMNEKQKGDK